MSAMSRLPTIIGAPVYKSPSITNDHGPLSIKVHSIVYQEHYFILSFLKMGDDGDYEIIVLLLEQ